MTSDTKLLAAANKSKKQLTALILCGMLILAIATGCSPGAIASDSSTVVNVNSGLHPDNREAAEFQDIKDGLIPLDLAESYFNDAKIICDIDDGKLWGKNLYSPMLFIHPETLDVVANEPDNAGRLQKQGNIYVGIFSENAIVSNSTTEFGGKFWSMVDWTTIPEDEIWRNALIIHEMFHYQQRYLNMESGTDIGYDNSHMDEMDARISIKLEWNALTAALKAEGMRRNEAIHDALIIRNNRRSQFYAEDDENKFEIHEGLAEYTGFILSCTSNEELLNTVENRKAFILGTPSFVRNFGYLSGMLYALLLDDAHPNWRDNIAYNTDLGEMLKNAYNLKEAEDLTEAVKSKYNYAQISNDEAAIKAEKDRVISDYRSKFMDIPTLIIASGGFNFGFDPNTVQPLPGLGNVYPAIEVKGDWGSLTVNEGGCLIAEDYSKVTVAAEDIDIQDDMITGKGWTLVLSNGYSIKADGRQYFVIKK